MRRSESLNTMKGVMHSYCLFVFSPFTFHLSRFTSFIQRVCGDNPTQMFILMENSKSIQEEP